MLPYLYCKIQRKSCYHQRQKPHVWQKQDLPAKTQHRHLEEITNLLNNNSDNL